MAQTRTQRLRTIQAALTDGLICEDMSTVVHEFANGWSIRQINNCGDVRREGYLMRNCCAKYAGDTLFPDEPGRVERGERDDQELLPDRNIATIRELDLLGRILGLNLYSLRDTDNIPHLTLWAAPNQHACGLLGTKNSEPKPQYMDLFNEWAEQNNITHETNSLNLLHLDFRTLSSQEEKLETALTTIHRYFDFVFANSFTQREIERSRVQEMYSDYARYSSQSSYAWMMLGYALDEKRGEILDSEDRTKLDEYRQNEVDPAEEWQKYSNQAKDILEALEQEAALYADIQAVA